VKVLESPPKGKRKAVAGGWQTSLLGFYIDTVLCYVSTTSGKLILPRSSKKYFQSLLRRGAGPEKKGFLQDGCPRQNSRVAQKVWTWLGYEVVKIPARLPDLNPIEK